MAIETTGRVVLNRRPTDKTDRPSRLTGDHPLLGCKVIVKGGNLVRNVKPVNVGPVGTPGEHLGTVFGDQQDVLKLRAPLSVRRGRRPVVRPHLSEGERGMNQEKEGGVFVETKVVGPVPRIGRLREYHTKQRFDNDTNLVAPGALAKHRFDGKGVTDIHYPNSLCQKPGERRRRG